MNIPPTPLYAPHKCLEAAYDSAAYNASRDGLSASSVPSDGVGGEVEVVKCVGGEAAVEETVFVCLSSDSGGEGEGEGEGGEEGEGGVDLAAIAEQFLKATAIPTERTGGQHPVRGVCLCRGAGVATLSVRCGCMHIWGCSLCLSTVSTIYT